MVGEGDKHGFLVGYCQRESQIQKDATILRILLVLCVVLFGCRSEIKHRPGQVAPDMPIQEPLDLPPFPFSGYQVQPLASFEITARILSKERYYIGRESKLSPIDLALGWGAMSDSEVLKHFDISQSHRWYRWWANQLPIPKNEVISSSANMHMVPQNKSITKTLLRTKKGDVIHIEGYLVRIEAEDGWHWQSSLTRSDSGDGACEVIFVHRARVLPRP